jgi:SAM-dependent methyltransferase
LSSSSHYVHGTSPSEQLRLARLNDLLNEASLCEMAPRRGDRVLDAGSGLGQFSRALARAAGTKVVAVEKSPDQLRRAQEFAREAGEESLVDFRPGDVRKLPLSPEEWGSFDVAHARFVLEHLPDPLTAVSELVRAVRPGGRIVLEDDDHAVLRLWPDVPEARAAWNAYVETYAVHGNDAFIGRRLVSLLRDAGALPVRNTWIFFGSCAGNPSFEGFVENLAGVLESSRRDVVVAALLSASALDAGVASLRDWGRRSDAAIWYAMAWAEGRRPH